MSTAFDIHIGKLCYLREQCMVARAWQSGKGAISERDRIFSISN